MVDKNAFLEAVKKGELDKVMQLLGSEPGLMNARSEEGQSAELLLTNGAKINASQAQGETALSIAQKAGQAEMAAFLIKHGAGG